MKSLIDRFAHVPAIAFFFFFFNRLHVCLLTNYNWKNVCTLLTYNNHVSSIGGSVEANGLKRAALPHQKKGV